ncbi:MAG: hypothetical protein JWO32_432 [Bacteroidetes bacterium]|nr:hypothetical protein [Bacteroidota bacterium]
MFEKVFFRSKKCNYYNDFTFDEFNEVADSLSIQVIQTFCSKIGGQLKKMKCVVSFFSFLIKGIKYSTFKKSPFGY